MEQLIDFFGQYGLELTLIAIVGIILLGILKYNNVFSKIQEDYRHYLYIGISVVFSIVSSIIYLACVGSLDATGIFVLAGALYVLNQAFYNIFKAFSINDLCKMGLDALKKGLDSLIKKLTKKDTDNK